MVAAGYRCRGRDALTAESPGCRGSQVAQRRLGQRRQAGRDPRRSRRADAGDRARIGAQRVADRRRSTGPVATSLLMLECSAIDRNTLARRILRELAVRIDAWRSAGGADAALIADYQHYSLTLGSRVRAILPGDREVVGSRRTSTRRADCASTPVVRPWRSRPETSHTCAPAFKVPAWATPAVIPNKCWPRRTGGLAPPPALEATLLAGCRPDPGERGGVVRLSGRQQHQLGSERQNESSSPSSGRSG